ncbi:MAG: S8 family serine peptidase [Prosthecobacter sp.]
MAKPSHLGGWLIIFATAGLLGSLVFWFNSRADVGKTTSASTSAPSPKKTGQPGPAPAIQAGVPTVAEAARPTEKKATAQDEPPVEEKPRSRWMEGDVLWTSPLTKGADGALSRVRLLETQFRHPLIRAEEKLSPGEDGGPPTILQQNAMVADHLLVKAAPGVNAARLAGAVRSMGCSVVSQIPGSAIYLVKIVSVDGGSLPNAIQALSGRKDVIAYAEPDHIVHATVIPNDPRFGEQWSLRNTGQNSGTVDADIDAPEAWDTTTGSSSVVVAVLDSGLDHTHPDLAANVWSNPGEIAGNGVDDDGNGYIDDVRGWNFLNGNSTTTDSGYHGTHVSGIIGAVAYNTAGISGVAWQVRLMPLKFLDYSGFGATSAAISAVNYARMKGAHIINHSWGMGAFSQPLKDAIDAAGAAGMLNVCAADNGNGRNEDVSPNYPSGYASASVLSVASTTNTDALSTTSDYGPATVHLGAPGTNILSTAPGNAYYNLSGTSMATPHVSGIAVLLKAHKPSLTGTDLKAILHTTVDLIPPLTGRITTGGRANARRALDGVSEISVVASTGADFAGDHGGTFLPATKVYTLKNHGSTSASWTAGLTNAYYASVSPASGTLAAGATATVTVTLNASLATSAAPGLYEGTISIVNTTSGRSTTWPLRMDVRVPYLYSYDLGTDPGWPRDEAWQFGAPQGKGGTPGYGNADPASARTGSNVLGVNLNGNAPTTVNGPHYLTAGPFDLRGHTETKLSFWRWLNTNSQFNAVPHAVQIRNENSETWTYLWSNSSYIYDNAWTEQVLPLGANGDGRAAVYIRWAYEVTSANATPVSSWNIDDIKITGQPGRRVFLDGVAAVNEDTGVTTLNLRVEPAAPTDLVVALTSSDATAATLPPTFTVPANTRSVNVQVTLVDDALLDGTQTAVLSPSVAGYASIPLMLAVNDNETATLSLNVPATGTEGGSPLQGTVNLSSPAGGPVLVSLASSMPNAASVPAGVIIPAGQTHASFAIALPQNGLLENARSAQITASVAGWAGASANLNVLDDDYRPATLVFPRVAGSQHLAEGWDTSTYTATVTLPAPRLVDTVITLTPDDATELALPATVTIPAGAVSATISPVLIIDDTLQDGVQTVLVTASAPGLPSGSTSVTVGDNEVTSLVFGFIPSPQTPGQYFSPGISALDVNGQLASGFSGTATVTALNNGVPDAAFGSFNVSFHMGFSNSAFYFPTLTTSYVLKAVAGAVSATSNVFSTEGASYRSVSVTANDLAYDPVTSRVYASTSSGTLVPIHPDTGATETPITVSIGAVGQIEVAASGGILYAVVNNRSQIVKVDLVTRTVGTPFSVGASLTVADFAILPNDSNTVGVVLDYKSLGTVDRVAVYTNGVKRPTVMSYNASSPSPVFVTEITAGGVANRFYASNATSSDYVGTSKALYVLDVDANGVSLNRTYPMPGTMDNLTASGSMVADDSGRVFDGETGNSLGRIGTTDTERSAVILEAATGRACRITHTTPYYYDPYALSVFELTGFSETGRTVTSTTAPATVSYPESPTRIVKAGTRGAAYRTASTVVLARSYHLLDAALPEPDLAVQQMTSPTLQNPGQPMSFNMLVRNNGSAPAANVVLTSEWTPGSEYLGSSTTKGTLTQAGTRVTVNLGALAAGETATICVQMVAGTVTNTATITSNTPESFTQNNLDVRNTYPPSYHEAFATMTLKTVDLASSKATGRVYATQGFGTGFFAGTLAVLDLEAPAVRAFLPVGSGPGMLTLAENQTDLHIALDGTGQVLPFNVSTLTAGPAFSPGTAADGRRLFVKHMVSRPGSPGQVIIARKDIKGAQAGVGLFVNGSLQGATTAASETMHWLAVSGDGSTCYGSGTVSYDLLPTSLHRLAVSSSGVTLSQTRASALTGSRIHFASGRVLGATGLMFDPATLADAGFLEDPAAHQIAENLVYDPERERIYAKTEVNSPVFASYSSLDFQRTAGTYGSISGKPDRMVRWGDHGLAMSTTVPLANYGILWLNDEGLVPDLPVHVSLPAFVAENAGTLSAAGTVQLTVAPASDLTLALISSQPGLLQVPDAVTIPAGQTTATFNLTLINDALLNGARNVTITPAGVTNYNLLPGTVEVRDDEIGTLALALPATATEGTGAITGQASVSITNGPVASDVTVRLVSNRTDKLTVPASIVIPAGQSTVSFALTLPDDSNLDGTQAVAVTAEVGGWAPATRSIDVLDNETGILTLTIGAGPNPIVEGAGSYQTSVTLGGRPMQDLVITLASSRPDKVSVPATVTIPAGGTLGNFTASILNDSLKDGRQTVTITATAQGATGGSRDVVIRDNDLGLLQFTSIPHGNAGENIDVAVIPTTIDGDPVSVNASTITATMARDGAPVPGFSMTLSKGATTFYQGSLKMLQAGTNFTLATTLTDVSATSNTFNVYAGPMSGFVWDAVSGLPQPNVPFPVTVRAADGYGNPLTGFSGTADLTAFMSSGTATAASGGTSPLNTIMNTTNPQSRLTLLLSSARVTRAGRLRSLSLEIQTPPGRVFDSFVIRAKHTSSGGLSSTWDNAGYTILRQGALDLTQTRGWVEIPFTTPFDYNGTSSLQLDISFNNSGTALGGSCLGAAPYYDSRYMGASTTTQGSTAPENWVAGQSGQPYPDYAGLPNLRFSFGSAVNVTPATTGAFVNGVWTGTVTLDQSALDVSLVATRGASSGQSNTFEAGAVPPAAPVLTALPPASATTSRSLTWDTVATATSYYAEAATDNAFATPVASSGWITATTHTFTSLASGTRYHFRVKARKNTAEGAWSNIAETTMDTTGPVITLGSSDSGSTPAFATVRATFSIAGSVADTPAGVSSLQVISGVHTIPLSYNAEGSWTVPVEVSGPGTFPLSFRSTDAVGNVTQRDVTITRKADTDSNGLPDDWQTANGLALNGANSGSTADFDRDGRSNLLEHAFNTPANSGAGNGYPNMVSEVKSADGKTYLVYRHDRRRGALDLTYNLQFSTDLSTWSDSTFQTEPVGTPTLNPDGVTERVTVRILPDLSQPQAKKVFVRTAVTSLVP